jgi:hypothetical protein
METTRFRKKNHKALNEVTLPIKALACFASGLIYLYTTIQVENIFSKEDRIIALEMYWRTPLQWQSSVMEQSEITVCR